MASAGPGKRGIYAFSRELDISSQPSLLPVRYQHEDIDSLYLAHNLAIAWWFIILLYLLAWLGTIAWRHHRQRSLLEKQASASAP